jgi:Fur family iron response transcriptional regulator
MTDTPEPTAPVQLAEVLRKAGLRPTRQRLALGALTLSAGDRHFTAEMLHEEAVASGQRVSLATVYNTLHQFTGVGLLREVPMEGARAYFDTKVDDHHHFFFEGDGKLVDIPAASVRVGELPEPPPGYEIARVDVVVRLKKRGT